MSADTAPAVITPDPASQPYPVDAVPYPGLAQMYEAMASAEKEALDRWEIAARYRVFGGQGRHAVPPQARVAATIPDHPQPASPAIRPPVPAPADPVSHRKQKPPKTGLLRRHAKPEPRPEPVREQSPERTASVWQPPQGKSGTIPPPAPDPRQDAATLLPGQVGPVPAEDDPAAAAVQAASNEALKRAGADPADLDVLARPGDGRDTTVQMTAATERPEEQK